MESQSRNLIRWKSWTEPLNKISVCWTLNINKVNITLEEMSIITLWNFNILIILTEINFNCWCSTKFSHESINILSLLCGQVSHILVSTGGRIHEGTSVINDSDWIETIEERFEMSILTVLANSGNSGSCWFVVGFHERFTNNESIFLFFSVGLFTNPAYNLLVKLQDEAIIGIKISSLERSCCDFSASNRSSIVRDFEKSIFHVRIISHLSG